MTAMRFTRDSSDSPSEPSLTSMMDFELWTVESKFKNAARDVVNHTKQVDRDLDVLNARLELFWGEHLGDEAIQEIQA
eukprot:4312377-Prorocentrum_lima.AAC.1